MKLYDVEMAMCFTKKLRIMAPDAENAEKLAELIFKSTDALSLDFSDLDDFETLATPVSDPDKYDDDDENDNDDDGYGYSDDELDEDEELPFDADPPPSRGSNKGFLKLLAHMLSTVEDHNVHIHIVP